MRTHEGKTKQLWTIGIDTSAPEENLAPFRQASLKQYGISLKRVEINLKCFATDLAIPPAELAYEELYEQRN